MGTTDDLARLRALCDALAGDFAPGVPALRATPQREGRAAAVWYDDGDQCAEVHDDPGRGYDGDAYAAFFAAAAGAVPELLDLVGRLREALYGLLDGLDANHRIDTPDECGLTDDAWERRIKAARAALEGKADGV